MIEIRHYLAADYTAVRELHHLALHSIGIFLSDGKWDDDLLDIENHYLYNKGEFLVGILDNKIVCMGGFRKKSDTTAEIKRMRVNPDYHRRGFGQAILNQLEARAIELGYKELCLDTTTTQIPAQKLYKNNGFTEVGREKIPGFELILYRKKLKP